ncbi:L2 [Macaca mulatta papillomavirus 2]|uniref:Minor capsid protein L2 n=1 Tax=Macaca mulatta papillomavirus 2 TaxID=2294150 RepID=A0A385AH83_9PAPI|nr:L2 [Macaca mulatta papillomavirus 2]AXN57285.1 L2 [Macaca mulatta papillomavirus 2]
MARARAKRRKRASATQLYQTCKAAGTCPADVIPKVENTTIADQILRWGSLGVFFGGLGIGTGGGTGGRTGYIPVGGRPPAAPVEPGPAVRPSVAVETVAPTDPSIVTLIEESSFIDTGAPTTAVPEHGGFEITTSSDSTPAVLDVTSSGDAIRVTISAHDNPLFTEPSLLGPPPPVEADGRVLISTPSLHASASEDIPMETFVIMQDHVGQSTSTPIPGTRPNARLGFYSRANQQVRVADPMFLGRPARLVTVDNPAYEGLQEETLHFEHPTIHNPPDPDFMDIVALHRPALVNRRGLIRFSRLGQRASLQTRSGRRFGARVHFYQDLSPIAHAAEDIELQPLVPAADTIDEDMYDVYVDPDDVDIQDRSTATAAPTRVSLSSTASTTRGPVYNTTVPMGPATDYGPGPDLPMPHSPAESPFVPGLPILPQGHVFVNGGDFYLHPSYLHKRKRRKLVLNFFADGYVAA